MTTKHTPEPWADYESPCRKSLSDIDYRRARACVNACAGINPEAVPDLLEALRALVKHAKDLTVSLDHETNGLCRTEKDFDENGDWDDEIVNAVAAIAKMEGGRMKITPEHDDAIRKERHARQEKEQRRADVERVAEAMWCHSWAGSGVERCPDAGWIFKQAEVFIDERDRRREQEGE